MFLNIQIYFIILKTYDQPKNHHITTAHWTTKVICTQIDPSKYATSTGCLS